MTNDDGPHSPALPVMRRALEPFARVFFVVPDRPRSACGHAVTLHKPLRLVEHPLPGGAVVHLCNGFPADCVLLGAEQVCDTLPDLVISGINLGANLGDDVTYSGTVAGAMEAVCFGMTGVALSVTSATNTRFEVAVPFLVHLIHLLTSHRLPPRTFLNVNVPNCAPVQVKGVALTRLGHRRYEGHTEKRVEPRGTVYYWRSGHRPDFQPEPGTDLEAIAHNKISVTPLSLDLTAADAFGELAAWDFSAGLGG